MMTAVTFLASYVVSAAWQIPVLCLAGWLIALLVRRIGPAAQHRVWMGVLLLCVVVPALPAPRVHGTGIGIVMEQSGVHTSSITSVGSSNAWAPPLWVPVWLMQAVAGAWLLTVAYGSMRLLLAHRATRALVAGAEPLCDAPMVDAALQQCRLAFAIGSVTVLSSEDIAGPVTLRHDGRDVLLIPFRMLAEISQQDMVAAVAHECAHITRRDFTTHLLLNVVALPVRFHPVMEHVRRQMAATREMACDAAAASFQGQVYRDGLLRLAQWIATTSAARPELAMGFAVGIFDSNSLEDRMHRLSVSGPRLNRIVRVAMGLVAVVAMGGTASALAIHGMHLLPSTETPAMKGMVAALPAMPGRTDEATVAAPQRPAHPATIVQPQLVHQVDPEYPPSERGKGGGPSDHVSLVGMTVDRNGVPQHVHVVRSGGEAFDANATKAVSQYRFKPAMRGGAAIAADITVSVDFQIF